MLLDRHLGFMHNARVAQSCRLDNQAQAEFVQSHHESINSSKKFIGKRISKLVPYVAITRILYLFLLWPGN